MAATTPNAVYGTYGRATGMLMQELVIEVNYTDFSAAGTTEEVALVTLPSDWVHVCAYAEVLEDFADAGSISNLVLEVGVAGGDADALIDGHDVFGVSVGTRYQGGAAEGQSWAGVALAVDATATGANLGDGTDTALDSGKVRYHFLGFRIASDA